jgi:hypothetical protein
MSERFVEGGGNRLFGMSVNVCQAKRVFTDNNYSCSQPSEPEISPTLENLMRKIFNF